MPIEFWLVGGVTLFCVVTFFVSAWFYPEWLGMSARKKGSDDKKP